MQRLTGLLEITAAFFGAAVAAGPAASAAVAAALGCDARSCCSERQPKSGKASTAWYLMLLLQLLLLLQLQLLLLLFLLVSPLLPAALFLPLPSASASLQMYVDICPGSRLAHRLHHRVGNRSRRHRTLRTKEMMQPCALRRHAVSLVAIHWHRTYVLAGRLEWVCPVHLMIARQRQCLSPRRQLKHTRQRWCLSPRRQ